MPKSGMTSGRGQPDAISMHYRESPKATFSTFSQSKDFDFPEPFSAGSKKAPSHEEIPSSKDTKRRKNAPNTASEIAPLLKFKSNLWPSQAPPCEEEQTRLYNKFKKHLINLS